MLHEVSPGLSAVGELQRITLRKGKFNLCVCGTFAGTIKILKRLIGYDGFATQSGGDDQALLTNASAMTDIVADQLINAWVANRTDGSFAPITGNTTTTVTGTLIGGTDSNWDDDDIADIYQEIGSYTVAGDVEFESYSDDTEYIIICSDFTSGVINSEMNQ